MGQAGRESSGKPPRRESIARRARRIVEADFSRDECDTRSIARRLGVTRSRLCHAYRKVHDSTVGQDLRRLRIEAACRLLEEHPGELIKEVAAAVGFGRRSYRTFLNSFRQEMGMAPRRYQRLAAVGKIRDREWTDGDSRRRVGASAD